MFLAGDAMLVEPWSGSTRKSMLDLFSLMRTADVTIVNLETVIHTNRGYAQANSGGTWMTSPPQIADELAWAGVNMVCHANNHAFDFGSEGILETIENIERAGIVLSGSGSNLQLARAPSYLTANGRRIGHIAVASSYVPYGRASAPRDPLPGRPGINPLSVSRVAEVHITPSVAAILERFDRLLGGDTQRYEFRRFKKNKMIFHIGDKIGFRRGYRPSNADLQGNLESIATARENADVVVLSIHSHDQKPWLREFIVAALDKGADIAIVHGVHEICPVEIIKGCPVFYSLGNFVYQPERVKHLPSDAFVNLGLSPEADRNELRKASPLRKSLWENPASYISLAAIIEFEGDRPVDLRLVPLDLGPDDERDRGCPRIAAPEKARGIVEDVSRLSKAKGTTIEYDRENNVGLVAIPRNPN